LIGGYHTDLLAAASASISVETTVGSAVYMLPSMYNHDCGIFQLLFLAHQFIFLTDR
jgi:hypothetical protein